jgi:branched-chain amino acid transport system substrate-binding protein
MPAARWRRNSGLPWAPPTRVRTSVSYAATSTPCSSASRFLRQFEEAGLKGKVPVLANQTAVDEALLRSMGDEALGVVSTMHYSVALDTPANRTFVAAYRKAFNTDPGY